MTEPPRIVIAARRGLPQGWEFDVRIGPAERQHLVTLDRGTWESFSLGHAAPEDLVRHAIVFLLAKEPAESILPSFNVLEIASSFPDFPEAMKKELG